MLFDITIKDRKMLVEREPGKGFGFQLPIDANGRVIAGPAADTLTVIANWIRHEQSKKETP